MTNPFPLNQPILAGSPIFEAIHHIVEQNAPKLAALNSGYHSPEEVRSVFSEISGQKIDESVVISLPVYSDFGSHIRFGKEIFINSNVMFTDLGGITIEDNVLIGPKASILTVNHPINPTQRRGLILKPVHLKKNCWIGANTTILPGVTVGENAIVAAGAVVSKDVPDNAIVAGVPAKVVQMID